MSVQLPGGAMGRQRAWVRKAILAGLTCLAYLWGQFFRKVECARKNR